MIKPPHVDTSLNRVRDHTSASFGHWKSSQRPIGSLRVLPCLIKCCLPGLSQAWCRWGQYPWRLVYKIVQHPYMPYVLIWSDLIGGFKLFRHLMFWGTAVWPLTSNHRGPLIDQQWYIKAALKQSTSNHRIRTEGKKANIWIHLTWLTTIVNQYLETLVSSKKHQCWVIIMNHN